MFGCMNVVRPTGYQPLRAYTPISEKKYKNPDDIFADALSVFKSKGYLTSANKEQFTIETDPKNLGFKYWVSNNEKWNIGYKLIFQIIISESKYFYKLDTDIRGKRSGREDRSFEPKDFNETSDIINEIERELSNKFSM